MVKRSRDDAIALQVPQQTKLENPSQPPPPPPPPKRCREPSVGGTAPGKTRVPVERGRLEPEGNWVAGNSLPAQGSAAWGLPRWRRLWLGSGGGLVVDYEELLWGWFPFVDEDFTSDGDKVECSSNWQGDVLYEDIWQLKHINEVPSHSR